MTCCDSWGHCTRGPGCAAGSMPPAASRVATVGVSRRRSDDSDAEELSSSAWAMLNANEAPGQRGNVWFADDDPEQEDNHPKREPYTRVELLALVTLLALSAASSLAVFSGIWLLASLAQVAA